MSFNFNFPLPPSSVIFRSIPYCKKKKKKYEKIHLTHFSFEPQIISPQKEKERNKKSTHHDWQTCRDASRHVVERIHIQKKLRRTISADFSFDDGRTERRASCFSPRCRNIFAWRGKRAANEWHGFAIFKNSASPAKILYRGKRNVSRLFARTKK